MDNWQKPDSSAASRKTCRFLPKNLIYDNVLLVGNCIPAAHTVESVIVGSGGSSACDVTSRKRMYWLARTTCYSNPELSLQYSLIITVFFVDTINSS
ncbi:hypothetical protein EVAR_48520_1 [Eumeta japonica]|uniref:Uncharacterized protein n=1 Tax=Eumeta variegata TaxID=151549 RepID=A0A4C1Z6V0_EUMVA|nr:hypothetical protein EVAR_48520_1 [Eumeta japonica]